MNFITFVDWYSAHYNNERKAPEAEIKKPTMEVEGQSGWYTGNNADSWGDNTASWGKKLKDCVIIQIGSWPQQTQESIPPNENAGQNSHW